MHANLQRKPFRSCQQPPVTAAVAVEKKRMQGGLRRAGSNQHDSVRGVQAGSAASFVDKLQREHRDSKVLSVPPLQKSATCPTFKIEHYAGAVRYPNLTHYLAVPEWCFACRLHPDRPRLPPPQL